MQGLRKCGAYEGNQGLHAIPVGGSDWPQFDTNYREGKAGATSWLRGDNSSYGAIVRESL